MSEEGIGPDDRDASPGSQEQDWETSSIPRLLAGGAWKIATGGPRYALKLAHRSVNLAEKLALSTLRKRMDAVAPAPAPAAEDEVVVSPVRSASTPAAPATGSITASVLMARLLDASQEQNATSARERLALRIVRQLVPDEARILAALADGHSAALVHVGAGPIVGPATQRWLENLSPVGREAGVALIDQTPRYITHLRDLGLLESGDEDKSLQLKYQLIEADTKVRETCAQIEKSGLRPKFFRRTIRISDAGTAFWATCEPKEQQRF
ncbi:MAG TPA: Abi-alpha family protein [Nevskiaceae bacterium]|nr:Abi-alpha family protein [Nevskiaceae bacterium]